MTAAILLSGCDPAQKNLDVATHATGYVQRKAAIEALMQLKDERVIPILIQSVTNGDASMRRFAAYSLSAYTNSEAANALVEALFVQERDVKDAAFESLARHGSSALPALQARLRGTNDSLHLPVLTLIGKVADSRDIELFVQCLRDGRIEERNVAAAALEKIGRPSVSKIASMVTSWPDHSAPGRILATNLLAGMGPPALQALRSAVDPDFLPQSLHGVDAMALFGESATVPLFECAELLLKDSRTEQENSIIASRIQPEVLARKLYDMNLLPRYNDHPYGHAFQSVVTAIASIGKNNSHTLFSLRTNSNHLWRRTSVEALALMGGSTAAEYLKDFLKDEDWAVRISAAKALGRSRSPSAVDTLIACLSDDEWRSRADSKGSLIEALGDARDERAIPLLTKEFTSGETNSHIGSALLALGDIGGPTAYEWLTKYINSQSGDFYFMAEAGLRRLGNSSPNLLTDKLRSASPSLRRELIQALSWSESPVALTPLLQCLSDRDPLVREAAFDTLGKLGNRDAVPALLTWVNKPGAEMLAASALGKLRDSRAVLPLAGLLGRHPDARVRSAAADALGKIGDRAALPALVRALPDWSCNQSIGEALEKLAWKATTDQETVYSWVITKNAIQMKSNWMLSKRILLADVRSRDIRRMQNGVYSFVSIGQPEMVPELQRILENEGDKEMAETFLNCGELTLAEAGRKWAIKKGYSINKGSGAANAAWGRW